MLNNIKHKLQRGMLNILTSCSIFLLRKIHKENPLYMTTYTGKKIYLLDPKPEDFDIEDIAIGLSREYRFANQSLQPYTVGQHAVITSYRSPHGLEAHALLHDSTEAYLRDIPSPLKSLLPTYKYIERIFEDAIAQRFKLAPHLPAAIKDVDSKMCNTEGKQLVLNYEPFGESFDDLDIIPWSEEETYEKFMSRFNEVYIYVN